MAADDRGGPYLRDPQPGGPIGCETQTHAHRAALHGADLLDAYGRPGGDGLRQWAQELRSASREDFWAEVPGGGRPAAARGPDGRPVPHLGSAAVHLLKQGSAGRRRARARSARQGADRAARPAARRPGHALRLGPAWAGRQEAGHNPFGHRTGAVRVQETGLAVVGPAEAGYEKEAGGLLRGLLAAAGHFGHRLPEMYAGEQRADGSAPVPHPAACRPAATGAASGVLVLAALAGIRPDVPGRTVTLRPMLSAPLGEIGLTGLRVAGAPFSMRISRLGLAMVEKAADALQPGV